MQTSPSLFHYTHLSKQKSMDPMLAISRFCELFPPATARQTLWLLLLRILNMKMPNTGADLLLLYNELLKLLDANYLLSLEKPVNEALIIPL